MSLSPTGDLTNRSGQKVSPDINLKSDQKIDFSGFDTSPIKLPKKVVVKVPKVTLTTKGKKVASKTAPLLAQAAAVNPAYKQHLDVLRKFGIIK